RGRGEHTRRRERSEGDGPDVEEDLGRREATKSPVDGAGGYGEREGRAWAEERRAGEHADRADREGAVVELEGDEVRDGDEPGDGEQAEDVVARAEDGSERAGGDADPGDERHGGPDALPQGGRAR